jgi:hypothetical protein
MQVMDVVFEIIRKETEYIIPFVLLKEVLKLVQSAITRCTTNWSFSECQCTGSVIVVQVND